MTKTNGKHQQTKVYRQIPNKVKFRIYQLALICTEQYIYIYTEIEYQGINKGWGTRTLPPKQYAQVNITYKIKKQVLQQLLRAFFFPFDTSNGEHLRAGHVSAAPVANPNSLKCNGNMNLQRLADLSNGSPKDSLDGPSDKITVRSNSTEPSYQTQLNFKIITPHRQLLCNWSEANTLYEKLNVPPHCQCKIRPDCLQSSDAHNFTSDKNRQDFQFIDGMIRVSFKVRNQRLIQSLTKIVYHWTMGWNEDTSHGRSTIGPRFICTICKNNPRVVDRLTDACRFSSNQPPTDVLKGILEICIDGNFATFHGSKFVQSSQWYIHLSSKNEGTKPHQPAVKPFQFLGRTPLRKQQWINSLQEFSTPFGCMLQRKESRIERRKIEHHAKRSKHCTKGRRLIAFRRIAQAKNLEKTGQIEVNVLWLLFSTKHRKIIKEVCKHNVQTCHSYEWNTGSYSKETCDATSCSKR